MCEWAPLETESFVSRSLISFLLFLASLSTACLCMPICTGKTMVSTLHMGLISCRGWLCELLYASSCTLREWQNILFGIGYPLCIYTHCADRKSCIPIGHPKGANCQMWFSILFRLKLACVRLCSVFLKFKHSMFVWMRSWPLSYLPRTLFILFLHKLQRSCFEYGTHCPSTPLWCLLNADFSHVCFIIWRH